MQYLPLCHKTPNGRVGSVVEELLNVAWESDTDDDDYEDQLFIAESSEDEDEDEDEERLALEADSDMSDAGSAMDVDEPAMDVDEPDNSTMLSYLESLTTESAFHTFCLMVPDKDHAALWRKTFSTHPHWWELLCVFWEAQLRYAFFPGPNDTTIDGEDAFQRAVLVLRQMRMVHTQSSAWVDEVKKTKLGPTICDISDTATLINGLNPHADDLHLCQVLDKWVKEADSWVCTPIVFTPHPKPNARKLDPENPGKALFNIITSSRMEKLIPRQKLPDSIQLFVAESNFSHAWHHWLAISLEAYKFDVSGVDVHRLYSLFMDYIIKNPASVKRVADDTLRKILTRTVQVREMQEKARVWANAGQPIKWAKTKEAKLEQQQQWKAHGLTDEIVKKFPATACVNCFRLAEEHHCRQRIYVTEQDVEFLRGCGITMAPEGQRMTPGAPPKTRAHKAPTKLYTPDEIRNLGFKFKGYERDESIISRCKKQVRFVYQGDELLDFQVYEAFPKDI
ncbi:hypothetical protein B0H14DRAFT_3026625, partial [Mycena olivaceomarginata]